MKIMTTLVLASIALLASPCSADASSCQLETRKVCGPFVCQAYFEVIKDGQVILRTPYRNAAEAMLQGAECAGDQMDSEDEGNAE